MNTSEATLLAASIAAAAAITGTIAAWLVAARTRAETRRQQWWGRFTWAIEKTLSPDIHTARLGAVVLGRLFLSDWATPADNEMGYTVAAFLADRVTGENETGRHHGDG